MQKIVLDQNILTIIVGDKEFQQCFDRAKNLGHIEPLFTHVHLDQSNRIKDVALRDKILYVINSCSTTVTYGHVESLSRPGGWSLSAPEKPLEEILGNQANKDGHIYDALLASTAFHEAAIFVTNDQRLKKRCLNLGKKVMSGEEFKSHLQNLLPKKNLK